MSKLYVPNSSEYACIVVRDNNTIRAYRTNPNYEIINNNYVVINSITATSKEQYIDTGLALNNNYRVLLQGHTQNYNSALFFDSYYNQSNRFGNIVYNKANPRIDYWDNNVRYSTLETTNIDLSQKFILEQSNSFISVSQGSYKNVLNYEGNLSSYNTPLLLFGTQRTDLFGEGGSTTLYYLRIYDGNDNLVRDYVPVRRLSDNVIGLYDKANNRFYQKNGGPSYSYDENSRYVEYDDFYMNSHYVKKSGTEYVSTNANITCNNDITSEIYYRNDVADIFLVFSLILLITFGIPYKLLKTFRKGLR